MKKVVEALGRIEMAQKSGKTILLRLNGRDSTVKNKRPTNLRCRVLRIILRSDCQQAYILVTPINTRDQKVKRLSIGGGTEFLGEFA